MVALKILYQNFDPLVARAIQRTGLTPSCSSGCSACCHGMQTTIHLVEAVELWEGLLKKPDQLKRVVGQLPTMMREARLLSQPWMNLKKWQEDCLPCPVLDGSRCGAYESRPSSCRAYVSFSPAEDCSLRSKRILMLDRGWVTEATLDHFDAVARGIGIPDMGGPLQYVMLIAVMARHLGQAGYRERIAGTLLEDLSSSMLHWIHLERDDFKGARRAKKLGLQRLRQLGLRYVPVKEILDWPEMAVAIQALEAEMELRK